MLRAAAPSLALAVLSAGCATRSPAAPTAPFPAGERAPLEWPARDPDAARLAPDELPLTATRERRVVVVVDGALVPFRYETSVTVLHAEPRGRGVVLEVREEGPDGETRLEFVSSWTAAEARRAAELGGGAAEEPAPASLAGTGVAFGVRSPPELPARGCVLLLHGMGSHVQEEPLARALLERGWAVVESDAPFGTWERRRIEGRDDAALDAFAAELAGRLDERIAEWAYACEAVLAHIEDRRPELRPDRAVVVGASAGALAGPAVALRVRDRLRAVVLAGGGADLCRISFEGRGSRFGLSIEPPEGGGNAVATEELSRRYLERSQLDPWRTAPHLAGTPVLLLHAAFDRIVPAAAGDLLRERLGQPERWTFPLGHRGLFWRLPAYAGEVAAWIEAHAGLEVAELAAPRPPARAARAPVP